MQNSEAYMQKDKTELLLLIILIALGVFACTFLILAFTTEKNADQTGEIIVPNYQKQADEAVLILNILKEAILDEKLMKTEKHKELINSIQDGEDYNVFGSKFAVFTEDYGNLKYYKNRDIVFHRSGGRPQDGVEFYIEAKSTLRRAFITQEEIDEKLCIRLYSDGSIEQYKAQ